MTTLNLGELARQSAPPPPSELVPQGTYEFIVRSASPKVYRSGNHGVDLDIDIKDGPVIRWVHLALKLDSPGSFFDQMEALGIERSWFDEYGELDDDELDQVMKDVAVEVVGRRAKAFIKVQNVNGRQVNSVGFFRKVTS